MLQYMIKTINNSLLTILAMSLLFAAVARLSRKERKTFLFAAAVGAAAAFVFAVLKRTTGFAVREYYDLGVLLPSVVFTLSLLCLTAWMLTGRSEGYRFAFRLSVFCVLATWTAYILPDLLLYPFEFAVGMDTIFNTEFMYKVAGYLAGLLIALLTGIALYAAAEALPDEMLLPSFAAGLCVMGGFQVLTVAQILLGRNLIPRYKWLMPVVMWGLTHAGWFLFALMGLAALPALTLLVRAKTAPVVGDNPAQRRKAKADARRRMRFGSGVLAGLLVSLLLVTVGESYANRAIELSPPLEVPVANEKIAIPLENVNDGNLHRFVYKASDGTEVRYIAIRKSDVAYGVGLDACDVCGASGYYQRKDQVVCILCDVVMNISTIGFPGGCNPVPLKYRISDGCLVVDTKDLEAEKRRFK